MMKTAVTLLVTVLAAGLPCADAYTTNVHRAITTEAVEGSSGFADFLEANGFADETIFSKCDTDPLWQRAWDGGWCFGPDDERQLNYTFLEMEPLEGVRADYPIRLGSILEDAEARFCNHFYRPVPGDLGEPLDQLGVDGTYRACTSRSGDAPREVHEARLWALGPSEVTGNVYAWQTAVERIGDGLAATDPTTRRTKLAEGLSALGQTVHLIQDMSVPSHVRGDVHTLASRLTPHCLGPCAFEDYLKPMSDDALRSRIAGGATATAGRSPGGKGKRPSTLFDDLARFTARNFFSDDTILRNHCAGLGSAAQPVFTAAEWAALGGEPRFGLTNALEVMWLTAAGIDGPLAAFPKVIGGSPIRDVASAYRASEQGSLFDPDNQEAVLETYARNLLPRAAEASRALIDYFFRVRLAITDVVALPSSDAGTSELELRIENASPASTPDEAAACSLEEFDAAHVVVLFEEPAGHPIRLEWIGGGMAEGSLPASQGEGDCPRAHVRVRIPGDLACAREGRLRIVYRGRTAAEGLYEAERLVVASAVAPLAPGFVMAMGGGGMLMLGVELPPPGAGPSAAGALSALMEGMGGASSGDPSTGALGDFMNQAMAELAQLIHPVCPGIPASLPGLKRAECCFPNGQGEFGGGADAGGGDEGVGVGGSRSGGGDADLEGGGDYLGGQDGDYQIDGGEYASNDGEYVGGSDREYAGEHDSGSGFGNGSGGGVPAGNPCPQVSIEDQVTLLYSTRECWWSYRCAIGGTQANTCEDLQAGGGLVAVHSTTLSPGQRALLRVSVQGQASCPGQATFSLHAREAVSAITQANFETIKWEGRPVASGTPSGGATIEVTYEEARRALVEMVRRALGEADIEAVGPAAEVLRCITAHVEAVTDEQVGPVPVSFLVMFSSRFSGAGNRGTLEVRTQVEIGPGDAPLAGSSGHCGRRGEMPESSSCLRELLGLLPIGAGLGIPESGGPGADFPESSLMGNPSAKTERLKGLLQALPLSQGSQGPGTDLPGIPQSAGPSVPVSEDDPYGTSEDPYGVGESPN